MKATVRHGAVVALTAMALGAGLAACGGGNDTASPGNPVWPGVGRTAAAASATGGGGSTPSTPSAGSAVDAASMMQKLRRASEITTSAHETLSMDFNGQKLGGQGDLRMKPLAEDMTLSVMGMSMEVRFVGDTFYVKLRAAAGLGGKWLKATTDELASASGMSGLTSMSDPLAMLTKLDHSMRSATFLGTDSTGQHYAMTVDTKKMMRVMGASGAQLAQLQGAMPATVTEDVWFDAAGHVTEVKADLGAAGATTVTMSDFGKHVDVAPPPASATQDLSSLGGLGGATL